MRMCVFACGLGASGMTMHVQLGRGQKARPPKQGPAAGWRAARTCRRTQRRRPRRRRRTWPRLTLIGCRLTAERLSQRRAAVSLAGHMVTHRGAPSALHATQVRLAWAQQLAAAT